MSDRWFTTQAEPSALDKKLFRKRQRQEQSDAVAGELGTHGLADSDEDGEGESKTASFKAKRRTRDSKPPANPEHAVTGVKKKSKKKKSKDPSGREAGSSATSVVDDDVGVAVTDPKQPRHAAEVDDAAVTDHAQGDENQGLKRKARRKKKATKTDVTPKEDASAKSEANLAPPAVERFTKTAVEGHEATNGTQTEQEPETRKQRRGFGKGRSTPSSATATSASTPPDHAVETQEEGSSWGSRPRKKTRSKQKNIRKDKRPLDQRPSYLRFGDPEYAGRGLTEETRKILGLPMNDGDVAPPSGWGKAGNRDQKAGWVIDKKPDASLAATVDSNGSSGGGEEGVAVQQSSQKGVQGPPGTNGSTGGLVGKQRGSRVHGAGGGPSKRKKPKYRNLQ